MRRTDKRVVLVAALALAALVTACVLVALVYYPSWRAEEIRAVLQNTEWRHSDNDSVRRFAARFGGKFECSHEWCEAEVLVTNRVLALVGLSAPMHLRVLVHTRENKVENYSLLMSNAGEDGSSVLIAKLYDPASSGLPEGQSFDIRGIDRLAHPQVAVRMTPSATPDQQRLIQEVDLGCLSRIRGCSREELGREVWRLATFSRPAE